MAPSTKDVLKAGLAALHYSGAARAFAPFVRGNGAIFMLHHVRPQGRRAFDPNGMLTITPEFLDTVVREVKDAGFDLVSLNEAHARMTGHSRAGRPFACFTFDDGYRDNRDYALSILRRHGAPLTIYATTDFADGRGLLWWLVLERVVRDSDELRVRHGDAERRFACASAFEKKRTFQKLYWWLRDLPEREARAIVVELAGLAGIDPYAPCRELVMTWDELREIAADPLVTVGAHSVSHLALAQLDGEDARSEIARSVARIERELGRPCRHFCYPYGNAASAGPREFEIASGLGLATAVTTRKGFVTQPMHAGLTALPRVSLNGDFQTLPCLKALLSGVPFALWNAMAGLRRQGARPVGSPGADLPSAARAIQTRL